MAVPLIEPSRSTANGNPPCDPYVLGALIGDGNLRDAVILTSRDPELTGRVATRVAPMGVRLKRVTLHGAATISWRLIARGKGFPNPVREAIKALGLNVNSEEKFVPEPYFAASLEERLELLRGLLDTDGTVDRLGVVSFTSCSFRLAKDFQRLAWSVGCIATIGATKKPSFIHRGERRRGRDAYTVFLQHPRPASLFALSRKQRRTQRLRPRRRLGYRLLIVSVTPLEPRECVCIAIDSPSGLYVTNDYVVTHNTTILHALVAILKAKKVRVHLAAPTGRAAQRLAETTGGFASTIHRLLKFDGAKGGFTVNENSPLATDFLIVDEASMLDTRLAAALFAAVPSRAHLLLVGDIDQLPSVGAGNVLKDLIACGDESRRSKVEGRKSEFADSHCAPEIPVTRLSMIYRQQNESHIVATAHAINAGEASPPPVVNEVGKASAWSDLNFIAAYSAEDCVAKVLELCSDYIPRHCRWLHPINDVQVLAPMHKGVAGVANLNRELQTALNPAHGDATPPSRAFRDHGVAAPRQPRTQVPALRTSSGEFRPGDKLIQLRNNYDQGLFNGDIGTVVSVNPGAGTLTADFDGEKHVLERGDFGDIAPAYAISIHKCVAADTWVLTTQGWQQIGDLWPARGSGVRVRAAAFQLAGPAGVVRADQVYRGTVEPAIRLITRHGFHLTGSHRHPVLVQCPTTAAPVWKKLPEVRPGDFVAIRRDMGLFPRQKVRIAYEPPAYPLRRRIALPATVNAEIALLLGYLVGDGAYAERKDGDVRLTNADRTLVRNYARILRKHFGLRPTLSRSTTHKTAPTWYVISKSFREWLAAAGLGFVTARVKSVPSAVLRSPRDVQAAFLRGLFDTDGSASGNGTRVVLATTSFLLAEQVRMMLLNCGIITALLHIPASDSWRVEMYGANLRRFEQRIGFGLPAKARQLRRLARRGDGWKGKTNVDIIPGASGLWRELKDAIQQRLGPTKGRLNRGLFAHSFLPQGLLLNSLARGAWRTNYRHLDELLSALGRRWPWVKRLAPYDPVRRIVPTKAAMFDLHVPGTHAFLTNGLISHNSQGSEYPAVVIILLKAHFIMLQRNLLYTALTRGKKKVFLVGEPAAYAIAVRNSESKQRVTHLREKLAAQM